MCLKQQKTTSFFFSHVCAQTAGVCYFCCTSAGFLTFCFFVLHPRPAINREVPSLSFVQLDFSSLSRTYYKTQLPLRFLTEHTVRPQRRWHFVFHFFLLFWKCASCFHAVKNSNFIKNGELLDMLKTNGKWTILSDDVVAFAILCHVSLSVSMFRLDEVCGMGFGFLLVVLYCCLRPRYCSMLILCYHGCWRWYLSSWSCLCRCVRLMKFLKGCD